MNHEIFICYSKKDISFVESLVQKMELAGFSCWFEDRDLSKDSLDAEKTIEAINKSKIFILVFTDSIIDSDRAIRETEIAINSGCVIIPFKLTRNDPTGSMRYYLASLHWFDVSDLSRDVAVEKLIDLVESIIKGKNTKGYNRPVNKKKQKTVLLMLALFFVLLIVFFFYDP